MSHRNHRNHRKGLCFAKNLVSQKAQKPQKDMQGIKSQGDLKISVISVISV